MAIELIALRFDPDAVPPCWEFQLVDNGVRGAFYRTMRPGEESNPTRISLPDPEDSGVTHTLVMFRAAP